jgi:hypothetical protein
MMAPISATWTRRRRRLSRCQHEPAALLQCNVRCPIKEVIAEGMGDVGECPHGTGDDDHGLHAERATGRSGGDIAIPVVDSCQTLDFGHGPVRLKDDRATGCRGNDQMRLDLVELGQYLEQPDSINGATGARDTHE